MAVEVFRRKETKYLLTKSQFENLIKKIDIYLNKDPYYESKICNIYFDTDNYDLIINSLEKPLYKEKVRIRSYDVPKYNDYVFLEIKKKYEEIVGKRRIKIKLSDFYSYLENGNLISDNKQIKEEIDYCFKKYKLKPSLFLAYDRISYYDKNNKDFRITFDKNIRSRTDNLNLEYGDEGKLYFDDDTYLMETKVLSSFPLWFTKILSELKIYPMSFSKYGKIYENKIKEELYV